MSRRAQPATIRIEKATTPAAFAHVESLMTEYVDWLPFELCFQDFDDEVARLRAMYGPPGGVAFVAWLADEPVGVVGVRDHGDGIAELKRMWVTDRGRGNGIGRLLADVSAREAKRLGYRAIRLDTVSPAMDAAIAVYEWIGYRDIAPYRHNPIAGARFLELDLTRFGAEQQ